MSHQLWLPKKVFTSDADPHLANARALEAWALVHVGENDDHSARHESGGADEVALQNLASNAAAALVATSESTTSTSFTDLATAGPAVTVDIGPSGKAEVSLYGVLQNNTMNAVAAMGFAVSGASTQAAANNYAIDYQAYTGNARGRLGGTFLLTGLTPGSTTFTAKYSVSGGTGTFIDRRIAVVPL